MSFDSMSQEPTQLCIWVWRLRIHRWYFASAERVQIWSTVVTGRAALTPERPNLARRLLVPAGGCDRDQEVWAHRRVSTAALSWGGPAMEGFHTATAG